MSRNKKRNHIRKRKQRRHTCEFERPMNVQAERRRGAHYPYRGQLLEILQILQRLTKVETRLDGVEKNMATKEDIARMATKEDIADFKASIYKDAMRASLKVVTLGGGAIALVVVAIIESLPFFFG